MTACPECGARLAAGEGCTDLFNRMLALEWDVIGELGAGIPPDEFLATPAGSAATTAHYFAVATYQLQHPDRLEPEAVLGLLAGLGDVLAGHGTVAEQRLRARKAFDGPQRVRRRGTATRDPALGPWPAAWAVTVADVCDVATGQYIATVRRWAEQTAATIAIVRA